MKKLIVGMLVLCISLWLSACGSENAREPEDTVVPTQAEPTVEPTETPTPIATPTQPAPTQAEPTPTESAKPENNNVPSVEEAWNPIVIQRQILLDEGAMCGVLFLGYVDESAGTLESNKAYYQTIFEERGYLDDFPFLAEFPDSNFVETEWGQELYCIIPLDTEATVSVNQWLVDETSGFEGKTGEVLYQSEKGTPILLKCNVSEIVPDAELVIVDSNGEQMKWNPSLSGMDGSVFVESANGKVYDLTVYDEYAWVDLLQVMAGEKAEYYWDEENEATIAGMRCPLIKLGEYEEQAYPELAKNLAVNMSTRESKLFDNYERIKEFAKEEYSDHYREYETSESATIRRADSRVLSILFKGYLFEGGIHGMYYYWGENYDTETGSLLKLTDVVKNVGEFSKLVKEQLYTYWEADSFYEDFDFEQYFKENLDQIAWTLDYHGVTVYFNPFEIAPYATGIFNATVAFDANPELFHKGYTQVPDSYGIQLDMETPFYYDVDFDGELDEILVYGFPNEYDYIVHTVHVDQEYYVEADESAIAYHICSPHLLHMADGRTYLMIENLTDNDYRTNTVYELTTGTPVRMYDIPSGMHTMFDEENELLYREVLTNPYNFKMDSRTWCVGTYEGYQTYGLGEDGFPISYEGYYTFDNMPEFTVLKDLDLQIVNEYGELVGKVTVKKGECVKYYHTDSATFADFILSDGRMGRADLEWLESGYSIDGNAVEELFDGIIFAG